MRLLITGGCGFIGSHLIRLALKQGHGVTNLDKLTYAGNPANLADVETHPNYRFVQGDIADRAAVDPLTASVDGVVNVAAETHVDRSIAGADEFLRTNILGVFTICESIRALGRPVRLLQVSTDEVYGSIDEGAWKESDRFSPANPYSASKAAGELLAFSFGRTHGLDVVATRGANTYGPNQYPEKLIPYFVTQLIDGRQVPLYGDGRNVRDWLHVEDHARAILTVLEKGESGRAYNVPGLAERMNIDVASTILKRMGKDESSIEWVKDRPGHDRRYAVDGAALEGLGFVRSRTLESGLADTVDWYVKNEPWWRHIKEKSRAFFEKHYGALRK